MKVLVTRPRDDAERTARRLSERGYEAVVAPVLEIRPTGEAPPSLQPDALLFTSAHAVAWTAVLGGVQELPVFTVGSRTAEAARAAGFVDVRNAAGDASALAALVQRELPTGGTLVHVAGQNRKREPDETLRATGFHVIVWAAYRADPVAELPEPAQGLFRDGSLDAVLHYSKRSASVLVDLVERAGLGEALTVPRHVCLSADVASALTVRAGLRHIVARRPDEDSLLAALDGCSSTGRSSPLSP